MIDTEERLQLIRKRVSAMSWEDSASKADLEDPSFTVQELVRMSGINSKDMIETLIHAELGSRTEFQGRKKVKLSELLRLAEEFKWLKSG